MQIAYGAEDDEQFFSRCYNFEVQQVSFDCLLAWLILHGVGEPFCHVQLGAFHLVKFPFLGPGRRDPTKWPQNLRFPPLLD